MWQPQTLMVTIRNVSAKLAAYAAVLTAADWLFPSLYGFSLWPVFWTTIILTAAGALGDLWVMPRLGAGRSLLLGWPAMAFLIWLTSRPWAAAHVSAPAAALLALCIVPLEYLLHRFVLAYLVR
ncbi:MAG: DUF2512 family protein [Alicyclobacillaceae bacterium]|nr:DUF2512 family protein [Alicyclobacillaceae bacterium]